MLDHVTELVVHEFGDPDAPTLLLVHGLTEAGTAWPDAVRRWRDDWHVLAMDQRGHGSSPRFTDAEATRSREIWLADLLDLLGELNPAPIVVGHSLGGLIALRAAAARPDLVRALVLEDPARPIGPDRIDAEFIAHQEAFLDTFNDRTATEKLRMRTDSGWSGEEIDAWADCKPQVDRRMIRRGLYLGPDDWPELLATLQVPTLFVVPENGEMAPTDDELTNPLIEIARLPEVGHCVRRDDPDAYHAVVDDFLDRHRSGAARPAGALFVRAPRVGDAAAIAQVQVRSWQQTYRGMMSDEILDDPQFVARKTEFWTSVLTGPDDPDRRIAVAERGTQLVGVAMSGRPMDDDATWGRQLFVLYADAAEHGSGVGTALLAAVLRDDETAALWVAEPNQRARAFYRKYGFDPDGASQQDFGITEIRMTRTLDSPLPGGDPTGQ